MNIEKDFIKIGEIGVDAGIVWIGDPCYVFHNEDGLPSTLGEDWIEFCEKLGVVNQAYKSFNFELGHEGLGVCITPTHGEGVYPVYARFNKEGRITQVFIDFDMLTGETNELGSD